MCVNDGNTTKAEVEEIIQFLTQSEKTPLKALLAAITLQANTPGGICVAMANAPGQGPGPGGPGGQMPPMDGPGPGLYATPPVYQPPEKSIENKDDDDGGSATGNYL